MITKRSALSRVAARNAYAEGRISYSDFKKIISELNQEELLIKKRKDSQIKKAKSKMFSHKTPVPIATTNVPLSSGKSSINIASSVGKKSSS